MHIQITDFGSAKIFETEGEGTVHVVMSFHYFSRNYVFIFCLNLIQFLCKENITQKML